VRVFVASWWNGLRICVVLPRDITADIADAFTPVVAQT
jgi:hypothetical protein